MTLILTYIKEGKVLDDKNKARRMGYKTVRYVLYDYTTYIVEGSINTY